MKNTWYSFLPLLVVTVLALVLGVVEANKQPEYFSANSLDTLRSLNYQYKMVVEDLTQAKDSPLVSELTQADAFMNTQPDESARGLVVSVATDDSILLLQPVEALSDIELQTVAKEYSAAIPEFEAVEIDQSIEMFSPLYNWDFSFGESQGGEAEPDTSSEVNLAEEVVQVAVIDSGVDISHEVFANSLVEKGWNTLKDNTDAYDDVGHGTHVAGIIASKAPGVEIIPYKIVDSNGGKLSNVLEAFSKALDDEVEIINTSFGLSSPSYALEAMIEKAYEANVIVVSAAGNNSSDTGFYPAQYEHTIAVASVDNGDHKLPKSNYGDWVDVAALGYHVRSSLPDGLYGYKTGTSQAAPVVTAAVANLMMGEHAGDLTLEAVLTALDNSEYHIEEGELEGTPIIK